MVFLALIAIMAHPIMALTAIRERPDFASLKESFHLHAFPSTPHNGVTVCHVHKTPTKMDT
jgi:hypothetical protein